MTYQDEQDNYLMGAGVLGLAIIAAVIIGLTALILHFT